MVVSHLVWELGTERGSLEEQQMFLTAELILHTYIFLFHNVLYTLKEIRHRLYISPIDFLVNVLNPFVSFAPVVL